ncbi:MFS transporter [Streptomyces sp. NPDC006012]|uniref:bifunctional serine/threonine protein kinase/MFS transporter n=1 Tax=Streptomyces sp. NPDC006012 TaxID=3364739 RepID=UPI0036C02A8F
MNYRAAVDQLTPQDPVRIGPYRLISRLGEGGMGLVYLGRSDAGRTVAVKVVQAEHAQHPEFRQRFAREVAAARRVGGAWTAAVLDADTDAAVPWVATQYVPGPDLTRVVGRDFGPLPEDSVRILAHRLALALTAVHGAGLIHRDLKPSNVLVTVDGPRVIDFGIARAMDTLGPDSLLTRTGMLIGSPGFMSPEQVRGLELTAASDVFCLGAVLVYTATGRLLFGAGGTGLNAHLFRVAEDAADLTGVPESLRDLVGACLAKDPAERPTLQEVADRTASGADEVWLPSAILAQLGRHAAHLLDFAPQTSAGPAPAGSPSNPPVRPGRLQPSVSPQTLYTPTAAAPPEAPRTFGPPPAMDEDPARPSPAPTRAPDPRRWRGLAATVFAQLVVVLDAASLHAAAPSLARDLAMLTTDSLFAAYGVALVALLLLGGHLADRLGRKRTLMTGLSAVAVAAVVGALAPSPGLLIAALALQGAGAALVAPAALALVTAHFVEPKERGRAFGIYAAVTFGGWPVGLAWGGVISESVGWRSCLYANVLLVLIALLIAANRVHDRAGPGGDGPGLATPSLLFGSAGALLTGFELYGVGHHSWAAPSALAPLGIGVILLAMAGVPHAARAFARHRDRIGSLVVLWLGTAGLFALFPVMSLSLGPAMGLSPAAAGVAVLPAGVAFVIGATRIAPGLLQRMAPRRLIAAGLLAAAVGLLPLGGIGSGRAFAFVLTGSVLAGLGLGTAMAPLFSVATAGPADRGRGGVAAVTTTALQLGTALGVALFSRAEVPTREGLDTSALYGAAGLALVAGLCAAVLITTAAPAGSRTLAQAGSRLPE